MEFSIQAAVSNWVRIGGLQVTGTGVARPRSGRDDREACRLPTCDVALGSPLIVKIPRHAENIITSTAYQN